MTSTATTAIAARRSKRLWRARTRGGSVLIVSLIVLLALILVVHQFVSFTVTDALVADNNREDVMTAWGGLGGIEYGRAQVTLDDEPQFDSHNEPWAQPVTALTLGDTIVEVTVVDEDRKFNLLWLTTGTEEQQARGQEILKRLIERARNEENVRLRSDTPDAEELVTAIVEWLKDTRAAGHQDTTLSEDEARIGQADNDDIAGREIEITKSSPYVLLTIAELMQVKGVDRELIYGPAKTTLDTPQDPEDEDSTAEPPLPGTTLGIDPDTDEPTKIGLIDLVTAYTRQARQVNINTVSKPVLMALSEHMTEEIADAIIDARTRPPEDSQDTTAQQPPAEGEPDPDEDTASFRTTDVRNRQAFVTKLGENAPEIGDELWNDLRGTLRVTSEVFMVTAVARPKAEDASTGRQRRGRVSQTWRGLFLRQPNDANAENLGGNLNEDPSPPPPFKTLLMVLDRGDD